MKVYVFCLQQKLCSFDTVSSTNFNNESIIDMRSPWKNNDLAFIVMFDDEAEFTTMTTNERGTVQCCIFPQENCDPFVDSDNQSLIKSVTVLVRKCDWVFRQKQPHVGDQIKLPNNDKYKVATIDDEQNWFRLTGRSV